MTKIVLYQKDFTLRLVYPTYPRYISSFHFYQIGLQISENNDVLVSITDFSPPSYLGT